MRWLLLGGTPLLSTVLAVLCAFAGLRLPADGKPLRAYVRGPTPNTCRRVRSSGLAKEEEYASASECLEAVG